jgi:hypothetical protein
MADGIEKLVDELFRQVEPHQGYLHVSDGEYFQTREELFSRIHGRLAHGLEACRRMQAWLKKHDPHLQERDAQSR